MTAMRITEKEFPRYRGMRDLIPGHAYLDGNGVQILFLGRGRYYRTDDFGGWEPACGNMFLYMKIKDLDAKLADGRLTPDLAVFDPGRPDRPDFFKTVFFSAKPRALMEDLGKKYPATVFRELVVTDKSGRYYASGSDDYHWHIETNDG